MYYNSTNIVSDADPEVIVIARFISPVHVRKIMIVGGGTDVGYHPSQLMCYVNQDNFDFNSVDQIHPNQTFSLEINSMGSVELVTTVHSFTNITSLIFYFPANHGNSDRTVIRYIGMQGEHTHYRREAVNTTYEVLCNGSDVQVEGTVHDVGHLH